MSHLKLVVSNGQVLPDNVIQFKSRKKQSPIPETSDPFTQVLREYLNEEVSLEVLQLALQKKLMEEGKVIGLSLSEVKPKVSPLRIIK